MKRSLALYEVGSAPAAGRIAAGRAGAGTILALALALTAAGAGGLEASSTRLSRDETRIVPVRSESKIYVKNTRGKTIVIGRKDVRDVSVRASKFVRTTDRQSAERLVDSLTFDVRSDGDEVSILTRHPDIVDERGGLWSFLRRVRTRAYIDYTIEVPSAFGAKISCASGDAQVTSLDGDVQVYGSSGEVFLKDLGGGASIEISSGDAEVRGVRGDVRLRSSSGDAVVRDVGGSLNAAATSGDLEAYDIQGDATIELSSGDFWLDGCKGDVRTKTSSGDGEIAGVAGGVEAISGSGDIEVRIVPLGKKQFVVKSVSGDVILDFETPKGYGFSLEVSTSNGSIEGDLDIKLDRISRRVLKGVVGSGASEVLVETASGNVRIERAKP